MGENKSKIFFFAEVARHLARDTQNKRYEHLFLITDIIGIGIRDILI